MAAVSGSVSFFPAATITLQCVGAKGSLCSEVRAGKGVTAPSFSGRKRKSQDHKRNWRFCAARRLERRWKRQMAISQNTKPSFNQPVRAATSKVALLVFSIAVLWGGGVAALHGQSALDGFNPNANGAINAVVVQPDGKILLGGNFTTLAPNGRAVVTRSYIARLNPDGTLDTAFDPNANATVFSIVL